MSKSPIQSILQVEDLISDDEADAEIKDESSEDIQSDEDVPMVPTKNTSENNIENNNEKQSGPRIENQKASQDESLSENNRNLSSQSRDAKMYLKTNSNQFDKMTHFMLTHPEITKGLPKTPPFKIKSIAMWNELGEILNRHGPPHRGVEGWKKVWCDHKTYIRKKVDKNKIFELPPKGWPKKFYPLTHTEDKIARLLGYIEGGSDVTSTLSFQLNEPDNSSQIENSNEAESERYNHSVNQSNDFNADNADFDDSLMPLTKGERALLQTQIVNQINYTKDSKKYLSEINDSLRELVKYSKKSYELEERRFELEKQKFEHEKSIAAQRHQYDVEKLQLKRDILRLKQETAGFK